MTENTLPPGVQNFVRDHVPSMNHLECLTRLVRAAGPVPLPELVAGMHVDEGAVRAAVADLARSGLVAPDGDLPRYEPASASLGAGAAELTDAYTRFPVQMIRLIYERPKSQAQSFADAFRLRKD